MAISETTLPCEIWMLKITTEQCIYMHCSLFLQVNSSVAGWLRSIRERADDIQSSLVLHVHLHQCDVTTVTSQRAGAGCRSRTTSRRRKRHWSDDLYYQWRTQDFSVWEYKFN